jgi:hypothetical protein
MNKTDKPTKKLAKMAQPDPIITHAHHLYEQAKILVSTPLDRNKAKLVVELVDDAIKEFGITNQEKKVELRTMREMAEEVLPPKTIEELRKRAEGHTLEKMYPKGRTTRRALYLIVMVIVSFFGLLALKRVTLNRSEGKTTDESSPRPTPNVLHSPSATPSVVEANVTNAETNGRPRLRRGNATGHQKVKSKPAVVDQANH